MAGSKSQAWFTLVVSDAIQGDADSGLLTQDQADCIKDAYAASGAPASSCILRRPGVRSSSESP